MSIISGVSHLYKQTNYQQFDAPSKLNPSSEHKSAAPSTQANSSFDPDITVPTLEPKTTCEKEFKDRVTSYISGCNLLSLAPESVIALQELLEPLTKSVADKATRASVCSNLRFESKQPIAINSGEMDYVTHYELMTE